MTGAVYTRSYRGSSLENSLVAGGGGEAHVRFPHMLTRLSRRPELEPFGATHMRTPNINRLAARGITFKNHYVQQR